MSSVSGLALPNGGPRLHALVDLAAVAEASGWDGVFIEDYDVGRMRAAVEAGPLRIA